MAPGLQAGSPPRGKSDFLKDTAVVSQMGIPASYFQNIILSPIFAHHLLLLLLPVLPCLQKRQRQSSWAPLFPHIFYHPTRQQVLLFLLTFLSVSFLSLQHCHLPHASDLRPLGFCHRANSPHPEQVLLSRTCVIISPGKWEYTSGGLA